MPATSVSGITPLIPVTIAWGTPSLFALDGQACWGCQFELLPGATMTNASCTRLGVVGLLARSDDSGAEPVWRTVPGEELRIWATADTMPHDLLPFQEEILQSYREHMQRMGMQAGA